MAPIVQDLQEESRLGRYGHGNMGFAIRNRHLDMGFFDRTKSFYYFIYFPPRFANGSSFQRFDINWNHALSVCGKASLASIDAYEF